MLVDSLFCAVQLSFLAIWKPLGDVIWLLTFIGSLHSFSQNEPLLSKIYQSDKGRTNTGLITI